MTGSAKALIPCRALALLLFLASPPAVAQLPPAIQADRLLVRAEREIQEGDYVAAAAALERIMELQTEHGLEVPEAFWFKRGRVAQEAGLYQRAMESAIRYLEIAGQQGDHYRAALELLDVAEQAVQLVSHWESRMVVVPAGNFRMGCLSNDDDCYEDEEFPVHEVAIRSFALSKHEVTRGEYSEFVRATRHSSGDSCYVYEEGEWKDVSGFGWRNPGFTQSDADPVVCVNWEDARSFVSWLSEVTGYAYRLPTESEWEYAARAGSQTKYSWGNEIGSDRANCGSCGSRWDGKTTAPVGSFGANAFGLHDMHGNVVEWVEDCRNDGYERAPSDGSAWLNGKCEERVLRGGSWRNPPRGLRSAARGWNATGIRSFNFGFRVARTLAP